MKIPRRDFIRLAGGAVLASPLAARAQQGAIPVIGYLNSQSAWESADLATAFRRGLEETGYVEGRNVIVEYRWAEGHYERLPVLAADLVRRPVAVIAATGGSVTPLAVKAATTTIPIVFQIGVDPVADGLVASLAHPGGNLTGITGLGNELGPKRLQLLNEVIPTAPAIGFLVNSKNPSTESNVRDLERAARDLAVDLHVVRASNESDVTAAIATLGQLHAGGLVVSPDGFLSSHAAQLASLALRQALPSIYQYRSFAAAGGLMSYGSSIADLHRQVGVYSGRILKGEKPADLPVQQATKVELIINLKTAKALGLTVPLPLLGRADEVIE